MAENTDIVDSNTAQRPLQTGPSLQGPYQDNPTFHQVANYFGLGADERRAKAKKLASVINWAIEDTGSTKGADLLTKIKEAGSRLPNSEKKLEKLYRYIALLGSRSEIDRKIKAYEKEDGNK